MTDTDYEREGSSIDATIYDHVGLKHETMKKAVKLFFSIIFKNLWSTRRAKRPKLFFFSTYLLKKAWTTKHMLCTSRCCFHLIRHSATISHLLLRMFCRDCTKQQTSNNYAIFVDSNKLPKILCPSGKLLGVIADHVEWGLVRWKKKRGLVRWDVFQIMYMWVWLYIAPKLTDSPSNGRNKLESF